MIKDLIKKLKESNIYRVETLLVLVAIALAGIGAFIEYEHEKAVLQETEARYARVPVLAVNVNLKRGAILKRNHIKTLETLKKSKTANMLEPVNLPSIIGRTLDVDLHAGDVLLFSMITDTSVGHTIAEKIPVGKRVFTLLVQNTEGPAGYLRPGDHVDIIAKMTFPDKGMMTFTLLEDITIVAVDQVVDPLQSVQGKHISFFVDPGEMERLRFAQEAGTFFVSLRNPFDRAKHEERRGVNFKSFVLSEGVYESVDPEVKVKIESK